jgi:hypothetical protein
MTYQGGRTGNRNGIEPSAGLLTFWRVLAVTAVLLLLYREVRCAPLTLHATHPSWRVTRSHEMSRASAAGHGAAPKTGERSPC